MAEASYSSSGKEHKQLIHIERALLEDAAAITAIKTAAFNQEINTWLGRNGGPPGYDQVESEQDIIQNLLAYKILLTEENDEKLIGAFFLIPEEPHGMRFEDFVIDPTKQGKGYGYQVLQLVERAYPEIMEWRLSTPVFSVGNQHLYEKFGYVEQSRDEEEVFYQKTVRTMNRISAANTAEIL